jgi:drug/metabolite transporter (DMT)-like permease
VKTSAPRLAYLALAAAVIALGFSALFVRWAAAPGPVTGFYRMAIASLILAPLALRGPGSSMRNWPRAGIAIALLGGLSLSLDVALWNTAVGKTSAANATLFANTAPLWVALVAWRLFGETLRPRFWLGLGLTLVGSAAVAGADFLFHPSLGWGDVLALCAAFFYAGYYLCTEIGRRYLPSATYVWLAGVAATTSLLLLCILLGLPLAGYPARSYLAFAGLALVTQAFGYVAVGYALGHLPASIVSPTMVAQPIVTALLAIPFLNEPLSAVQWIGGAIVIAGILQVHVSHVPAPATEPVPIPQSAD